MRAKYDMAISKGKRVMTPISESWPIKTSPRSCQTATSMRKATVVSSATTFPIPATSMSHPISPKTPNDAVEKIPPKMMVNTVAIPSRIPATVKIIGSPIIRNISTMFTIVETMRNSVTKITNRIVAMVATIEKTKSPITELGSKFQAKIRG